jgi:Hypoxia induced protein conserved region
MSLVNVLFTLTIISAIATAGVLFAGLITMARGAADKPELARTSNKLMWWRVRLQMLTLGLLLITYLASRT